MAPPLAYLRCEQRRYNPRQRRDLGDEEQMTHTLRLRCSVRPVSFSSPSSENSSMTLIRFSNTTFAACFAFHKSMSLARAFTCATSTPFTSACYWCVDISATFTLQYSSTHWHSIPIARPCTRPLGTGPHVFDEKRYKW